MNLALFAVARASLRVISKINQGPKIKDQSDAEDQRPTGSRSIEVPREGAGTADT